MRNNINNSTNSASNKPGNHKNKKPEVNPLMKIYRFFAGILGIFGEFKLLFICKILTWRTGNPDHLGYIVNIIKDAYDMSEMAEGLRRCSQEFIFSFDLVKLSVFLISSVVFMLVLMNLPQICEFLISGAKALKAPLAVFFGGLGKAASKIPPHEKFLDSFTCFVRHKCIPAAVSEYTIFSVSVIINGEVYYGGTGIKGGCIGKISKLHLISADGSELDHKLPAPLTIVPRKDGVYVCGKFYDDNNTRHSKKMIRSEQTALHIGTFIYKVKAS